MRPTIGRQARPSRSIQTRRQPQSGGLWDLLGTGRLRSVYQPIVDLRNGEVVAHEALVRGPEGSPLERPDVLFAAAREQGLIDQLDWECQRSALQGALAAGLAPNQALFVNVEPAVSRGGAPPALSLLFREALGRFPVVVELTERALTDRPAELLALVADLRRAGARIALDDVGADPRSLALMPLLAPEVIKLDLALVQTNPSPLIAKIVHAVNAEAERTGALVLAEGIETEEHRQTALALGASYAQGWLFGRPAALRRPGRSPGNPLPALERPNNVVCQSPFEAVASERPTNRATKRLLLALSLQIEEHAAHLGEEAVVLSTFQEARHFTARTAERYARMAERSALVGALGVGLALEPAAGVRGGGIGSSDPLRGEWNVTAIGPHFAMAFVARELGDSGNDMDRRFDFAITYERDLAIAVARAMMSRLATL